MKPKYERAIAQYESKCQEAGKSLIAKIMSDVQKACRKWGFDFSIGTTINGDYWSLQFRQTPTGSPNNNRILLRHLDPDLEEALIVVEKIGLPLGDLKFSVSEDDYKWTIIRTTGYGDEPIELFGRDRPCPPMKGGYAYFGWIPEQVAIKILEVYSKDMEIGRALLRGLPRCVDDEELLYPID